FYVEAQSLAITPENLLHIASDVDVSGIADVRSWVNMKGARLKSVRGEIDINELRMSQVEPGPETDYAIDSIRARFGWRKRKSGWQFAAQDIVVGQGGSIRRGAGFSLAAQRYLGDDYYSGNFTRLYLQDLQSLVRVAPGIAEQHRQQIARLRPEGLVEKMYLDLKATEDKTEVLAFDASFRDLGIRPVDAPEVQGLHGTATGTSAAGALWLQSKHLLYRDSKVFREALRFDNFTGEVAWQYRNGHLAIESDALVIENRDLSLTVQLALELPDGGESPFVDLQIDVNRMDIGSVKNYLPAPVMPASGVAWLDRSLVSGAVADGSVVLKGRLDQIPFDNGEGRLEVRLPVSNAILDYHPDWTRIENLDARVDFTGRAMDIESHRGKIRSASLEAVNVQIKDLARPDLLLQGTVLGPLPVMLAELGSSPLGERYGAFVEGVDCSGNTRLDLNLTVPLHGKGRDIDASGNIILNGNSLKTRQDGIGFEKIKGELAFDTESLTGKSLQARLLDTPVRVDVRTDRQAGGLEISVQGPLDLVALVTKEQPELKSILSGHSNWNVLLGVGRFEGRNEIPNIGLELSSTLEGVAVELPAPFGKKRDESRRLVITLDSVTAVKRSLGFSYADILDAVLDLRVTEHGAAVVRGDIALGGGAAVLPHMKELKLSGRLDQFSLTEWRPVFSRFDGGKGPPVKLDLMIGELEILQHILRDVGMQVEESGLVQNVRLSGPTIAGVIKLYHVGSDIDRVVMNLSQLKLEKGNAADKSAGMEANPAEFPSLDITVQQLKYDGIGIGQVLLQTSRDADAVDVDKLALASDMLELRASGDWRANNGQPVSQFDIEITDGRLDKLLKAFDYQEDVSGGDMSGSIRASWPGAPWDFSPVRAQGKLYLLIKNGQLNKVKPGAGRIFGLVSLQTLQRRLSLDFSDLVKKGFAFDRIEGSFILSNGDAYTSDLFIEGPAARIEISGRVGLADEDYDELITVMPHVGSSLPIAGTIAGGPIVGAALLLVDHLLGDRIEEAARFGRKQYTVTGPWSDPVYTELERKPRWRKAAESKREDIE
ncbi:MAG: YhdP family protein, partial [Pseudomonadota bacterium]|nr:YhdP family protein [Pseudomonadota bacterium]